MEKQKHNMIFVEIVVAMAIVVIALFPLVYNYTLQARRLKALYFRAVAEQSLDGFREILCAGKWRDYPMGKTPLKINSMAMRRIAPSETTLEIRSLDPTRVKIVLKWQCKFVGCGKIIKQATVKK